LAVDQYNPGLPGDCTRAMMSSCPHRRRNDGGETKVSDMYSGVSSLVSLFVDHVKQGALRQMLMTQSAGTVCEIERQRHAVVSLLQY
jgi:hypothetical protein